MRNPLISLVLLFTFCFGVSVMQGSEILRVKIELKPGISLRQNSDPWLGKDKFDHFLASAFLTCLAYHAGRNSVALEHKNAISYASGITLSLGLGKEIWDKKSKRGHPSLCDLLADISGVALGFLICSQMK